MRRITLIIIPVVILGILSSCSRTYRVSTESMLPTLKPEDRVRIIRQPGYKPARGDIIAYKSPIKSEPDKIFIHRCIAMEGDLFEIRDYSVIINGKELEEPYIEGKTESYREESGIKDINGIVPMGMIVTLGDNREKAFDSRSFGYTPVESVIGRVEKVE